MKMKLHFLKVYFERREHTSREEAERQGEREFQAGFTLSMDPTQGLGPTTPGS